MKHVALVIASAALGVVVCQSAAWSQGSAGAGMTAELSGHGRLLVVGFVRANPFQLDASHVRLTLKPQSGGRSIVLSPGIAGPMPSIPAKNRAVVDLNFRLPDDIRSDLYAVKVEAPNPLTPYPALVYVPSSSNDVGLNEAKQRFEGRDAQSYGAAFFECVPPPFGASEVVIQTIPNQNVRITSVERSTGNARVLTLGGTVGRRTPAAGTPYLALDPLVVQAAPASVNDIMAGGFVAGGTFPGAQPGTEGDSILAAIRNDPANCPRLEAAFADAWELERFLSPDLADERASWAPDMREAVLRRQVLPGMTYEMVAAILGFPNGYGAPAQMQALSVWKYAGGPTVTFANGVVVEYHPAR